LQRVALVSCGVFRKLLPVHRVRASRFAGSRQAVLQVHARGYRRILILNIRHAYADLEEDHARSAGLQSAIDQIGPIRGGWIRVIPHPQTGLRSDWQAPIRKHKPDAVIGFNSADLHFVLPAGLTVPDELGFTAQEVTRPTVVGHAISGVAGRGEQMGAAAVDWIDQLIRLGRFGIPEHSLSQVFDPTWVEGGTLKPAP
jgi:DNA-binding LacI/PurR family transcriptional regulator